MLSFRYVTLFKYIFIIIKLNVLLLYNKNVQQLYKRISIDSLLDFDCTRKFNIPSEVISMNGKQLIRKLCYKINVTKFHTPLISDLNFFRVVLRTVFFFGTYFNFYVIQVSLFTNQMNFSVYWSIIQLYSYSQNNEHLKLKHIVKKEVLKIKMKHENKKG